MGHFLDIAYKVLVSRKKPMTVKDITKIGQKNEWLKSKGKTPSQTMKSKLSTDILNKKSSSLFMRTKQGLFALREWGGEDAKEFVADRFQKALLDEEIAVFPAASLGKYISGSGFHVEPIKNGLELMAECRAMSRNIAETDVSVIQLVSVFVVRYKTKYLTYKRTKRLPEARLHDSYSIGFGGHINIKETKTIFNIFEPANSGFLVRELMEELRLSEYTTKSIRYKGLLYDDSKEVSKQHLGVVFDVILGSAEYEIGERGFLMDSKFESIEEIEGRIDAFENWSLTLVEFEKKQQSQVD